VVQRNLKQVDIWTRINIFEIRRIFMNVVGLLVGLLFGALLSAVVIWIVGKLGLGIEVSGFGTAFIAALVIAVINAVVVWLLGVLGVTISGGWLGALINLVIAAIVLLLAGKFVKGLVVKGFLGAVIAAVAIGAVAWLIGWLINLIV
jgi:putative membrane protein